MTKSKPWRRFLPILLAVLLALGIALYAVPYAQMVSYRNSAPVQTCAAQLAAAYGEKTGTALSQEDICRDLSYLQRWLMFSDTPPHRNRRSPGGPPQVCHADHRYLHRVCGRDPLGHRYHSLLHSKRRRHNPRQRVTHSFGSHFPQRRSDLTEESIPTATPCPRQGVIFGKPREKCMPPLVSPRVLWHSEYGILSAQGKEGCYAV